MRLEVQLITGEWKLFDGNREDVGDWVFRTVDRPLRKTMGVDAAKAEASAVFDALFFRPEFK